MSSLIKNYDSKKVKQWPALPNGELSQLGQYLVNFNIEGEWVKYKKLMYLEGESLDNCNALKTISPPIPIIFSFKGKETLGDIIDTPKNKVDIMIPQQGVYRFTCQALLKDWNKEFFRLTDKENIQHP